MLRLLVRWLFFGQSAKTKVTKKLGTLATAITSYSCEKQLGMVQFFSLTDVEVGVALTDTTAVFLGEFGAIETVAVFAVWSICRKKMRFKNWFVNICFCSKI
jgi:hypothetical protein